MSEDGIVYAFHRGLLSQPECEGCPLQGAKIIPPEGNPHARIAIVGEGPGYGDEQDGRPFTGPAGKFLNRMLTQAGITREEVWLTNTILCRPKVCMVEGKPVAPENVLRLASKYCKSRLDAELAVIRPRVVVGLGAQSVRSIYAPNATLKGRRGAIHTIDLLQTKSDTVLEEEDDDDDEDVAVDADSS